MEKLERQLPELTPDEEIEAIRQAKLVKFFKARSAPHWAKLEADEIQRGIDEKEERRKERIRKTMKDDNFVNKPVFRK